MESAPPQPAKSTEAGPSHGADLFELPSDVPPATTTPAPEEAEDPAPPARSWREELQSVDWDVVKSLWSREMLIAIRSRAWIRLLSWFAFGSALLALLPILYRLAPNHWVTPDGFRWLQIWSLGTAGMLMAAVSGWTRRGIARELRGGMLDEIVLTGSGPADILLGKSFAAACLTSLLVLAAFPSLVLAVAMGGREPFALPRLGLTLGFCAYLGLCMGMEYSFRKPGTRSTVGQMWSTFYIVMLVGNLARLVKWTWLTAPRKFLISYNPLSTLMAAGGGRVDRWPLGILVFFLLLVVLTLVSFRLLRREWATAAENTQEGSWIARLVRPRRVEAKEDAPPRLIRENAVREFEDVFGHRVRIPKWAWIVTAVVCLVFLCIPKPEIGRCLFSAFLLFASAVAAHNGCAAFVRERETGRWEELALLPLTNREITEGKLGAGTRTWLGLSALGLASTVSSVAWGWRPNPADWAWAAVTLVALPWALSRLGALIGLVTANADEAQWRVSIVSVLLPALIVVGGLAGFYLAAADVLSPAYAGMKLGISGGVTAGAWVGTVLYAAVGLGAGRLIVARLRQWALPMAA